MPGAGLIAALQLTGNGAAMFLALKTFLSRLAADEGSQIRANNHDGRPVTAALLIRVATVHGEMSDVRRKALHNLLQSKYGLDDRAAAGLLEEAVAVNFDAIDLYRFVRQLNEILTDDGRIELVRMMWEVVYADGPRTNSKQISFGGRLIYWESLPEDG
jgi:uncharacterized tellurite resistance protein B-like protein